MGKYSDKKPHELGQPQAARPPSVHEVVQCWIGLACGDGDDPHSELLEMIKARPWLNDWYENGAPMNSKYVGAIHDPYPATLEELTTAPSPFDFVCTDGMFDKETLKVTEPHWRRLSPATSQAIIDKAHAEGKETREFDPTRALSFEIGLDDAAAKAGATWICYAVADDVGARYRQSYDDTLRRCLLMAMVMEKTAEGREQAGRYYLSRVWDAGVVLFADERHIVHM